LLTKLLFSCLFESVPIVILFLNWYHIYTLQKKDEIARQNVKSFVNALEVDGNQNVKFEDLEGLEKT
jgi:hypothetical protein